jgi:hypothetical protein
MQQKTRQLATHSVWLGWFGATALMNAHAAPGQLALLAGSSFDRRLPDTHRLHPIHDNALRQPSVAGHAQHDAAADDERCCQHAE